MLRYGATPCQEGLAQPHQTLIIELPNISESDRTRIARHAFASKIACSHDDVIFVRNENLVDRMLPRNFPFLGKEPLDFGRSQVGRFSALVDSIDGEQGNEPSDIRAIYPPVILANDV